MPVRTFRVVKKYDKNVYMREIKSQKITTEKFLFLMNGFAGNSIEMGFAGENSDILGTHFTVTFYSRLSQICFTLFPVLPQILTTSFPLLLN